MIDDLPPGPRNLVERFLSLHNASDDFVCMEHDWRPLAVGLDGKVDAFWFVQIVWEKRKKIRPPMPGSFFAESDMGKERLTFTAHQEPSAVGVSVPHWEVVISESPRHTTCYTDKADGRPMVRFEIIADWFGRYGDG